MRTFLALLFVATATVAKSQTPLQLQWDPNPGWQSNTFLIYRSATVVTSTSQFGAPWTNVVGKTNLALVTEPNEFYFYAVKATNVNGISDFSNVHSIPPVPRADANLTARRSSP